MTSNIQYPYQMPGLSRYRFNEAGECVVVNGATIRDYQDKYILIDDRGDIDIITMWEVRQYVRHLMLLDGKPPAVNNVDNTIKSCAFVSRETPYI